MHLFKLYWEFLRYKDAQLQKMDTALQCGVAQVSWLLCICSTAAKVALEPMLLYNSLDQGQLSKSTRLPLK